VWSARAGSLAYCTPRRQRLYRGVLILAASGSYRRLISGFWSGIRSGGAYSGGSRGEVYVVPKLLQFELETRSGSSWIYRHHEEVSPALVAETTLTVTEADGHAETCRERVTWRSRRRVCMARYSRALQSSRSSGHLERGDGSAAVALSAKSGWLVVHHVVHTKGGGAYGIVATENEVAYPEIPAARPRNSHPHHR